VEARVSDAPNEPTHNPAIPFEPKPPDDSLDDSPDLDRLRALAVAAQEPGEVTCDSRTDAPTRVDVRAREQAPTGRGDLHSATAAPSTRASVDEALAGALAMAAAAGQWALVAQLARELEARRLAAVATVDRARRDDG
jgi:hypothetical protein